MHAGVSILPFRVDDVDPSGALSYFLGTEHWLDASSLPAPPDVGRLQLASRGEWVDAALAAMRPVVEPVAGAATEAMAELASAQLEEVDLESYQTIFARHPGAIGAPTAGLHFTPEVFDALDVAPLEEGTP